MRANQAVAASVGGDRGGQHANDRGDRSVKRKFAENGVIGKRIGWNSADRGHDAKRDRQIIMATFLRQVSWRKIDGDALNFRNTYIIK
jgi:hypothetical protein